VTLRDLGFSELQEATYRALLADPTTDSRTLAAMASADEPVLRTALAALAEFGAIRPDPAAPAGYCARDPVMAIGELIERLEDEAVRRQQRIGAMRAELLPRLAELSQASSSRTMTSASADAGLELVAGRGEVRERLAELSFFTRSSVWSIQPAGPYSAASRVAAARLDQRGSRRGLDTRIIYDAAVLGSAGGLASLRYRASAGAQIRVCLGPLHRLIIMDERVAVVPEGPDSNEGAVIVRQAGLLHSLRELFLRTWEGAQELPLACASEPELPEDDQAALGLLAAGLTDEIAARQAGVSVRHFRRRVARLMERLDADSRFQAGATAARRGWI
jgi:hypothetical protein